MDVRAVNIYNLTMGSDQILYGQNQLSKIEEICVSQSG